MAQANRSMFLYGFRVNENNRSIDFRSVALETVRLASLNLGYYSLTSLCSEIKRALQAVDPSRTFTVTVDRTISGGLENRVTIATNGSHFEILGSSGPRAASSALSLIGFTATDLTGALTYSGSSSAGTVLIPRLPIYNYKSPTQKKQVFGNVNVSASGKKEAVVYSVQTFWVGEFKYEFQSVVDSEWPGFIDWIIQQREIEFTPDITAPTTFYTGTLERTEADSKGLAHEMIEQISERLPGLYRTGSMTFRVSE